MEYLYNTLYTNYAFKKLANNLANPFYTYSPYELFTIKVGDGDNSIDLDKTSLSRALVDLNITSVKTTSNTIIFTCEIPEDIKDINITEIGLFDRVDGVERLFSYSRVDAVKPAELGFELVVEINLALRTINYFPEKIKIRVSKYDYTTKEMLFNLKNMFEYIETNLERIIDFNSTEVGLNKEQVFYEEEERIEDIITNYSCTCKYFNLHNLFSSNLKNCFFIKNNIRKLSYTLTDLVVDSAFIKIYLNTLISSGDSISFNGGTTLSFTAKIGVLLEGKETPILNKIDGETTYFKIGIEKTSLNFLLKGSDRNYTFSLPLTENELPYYLENFNTYTITFNGDPKNPESHLYINGKELDIIESGIELGEITDFSRCPLKNYITDGDNIVVGEDIQFKNIVFLNKIISEKDIFNLYLAQKEPNLEVAS